MNHNPLPRWLGLSWPWIFAGSAVLTGWYLVDLRRGSAPLFFFGHVLWFIAAPCLLAVVAAHLWLIGSVLIVLTKKAVFSLFRSVLLAIVIMPLYVPRWLMGDAELTVSLEERRDGSGKSVSATRRVGTSCSGHE